jgi:alkaline phosphatase D
MTLMLNRRSLILTAGLGLGALPLIGTRAYAQITSARGFTHNVASGEPGPDSLLLWTRYVPTNGGNAKMMVEVSDSATFAKVVGGGQVITGPWRDHTAKITVDGLMPGKQYYYRFVAPDGTMSPVGRGKTLPVGAVAKFNIAIFSCSNLGFGYFNAYAHAAKRGDIDMALHLGDYFYEYKRGGYDRAGLARVAELQPETEILNIADYRLRYASYRADPDLQAIHQNVTMIPSMDDHESANDSWEGGAQNHQSDEGDWNLRRAAALQVWHEWLPVSEQPWKSYDIGTLASYVRTDTRLIARSRPFSYQELLTGKEPIAALKAFRDGDWMDPAATMFGTEQESWIAHQLRGSVKAGQKWQVVGLGTIIGQSYTPKEALSWVASDSDPRAKLYAQVGVAAAQAGLPFNLDNWGGYPAARSRFLKTAQSAATNLVVVSGDSHNGWAFDLKQDGKPAGVEFAGHAVTSPGFENSTKIDPLTVAKGFVDASPEMRWCDTSNRGYMLLSLTPSAVTNEYVFVDTVTTRSVAQKGSKRLSVRAGKRMLEPV